VIPVAVWWADSSCTPVPSGRTVPPTVVPSIATTGRTATGAGGWSAGTTAETRVSSQRASTWVRATESTRIGSRRSMVAAGRRVRPTAGRSVSGRSSSQSAMSANVTAPAGTAHTATADRLAGR
jgi:hypothetical protein